MTCLDDHTAGQRLRRDGQLIESRDALRECSATYCPNEVIRDCLGWLEELNRQIPSVSFVVSADGQNRVDAQVFIDDVRVLEKLNGRALDVNPGLHRVRVELSPFAPFEESIVFAEGDKFRVMEVKFRTPRPAPNAPPAPSQAPPGELEKYRPVPAATYVFGGLGLAAAVSGGAWGISNLSLRRDMENSCAPSCTDRSIEVLKQRALIADISWGVSIVSLATAATIYFLRPELPLENAVAADVRLLPAGVLGSVSVSSF